MNAAFLTALRLTLMMLGRCCGIYPVLVWAVAQLRPGHDEGVQLQRNSRLVGFVSVGQQFTQARYFNTRPSAVAYHADGSAGSNKGPGNPDYLCEVRPLAAGCAGGPHGPRARPRARPGSRASAAAYRNQPARAS